jgi:hypothetical protein
VSRIGEQTGARGGEHGKGDENEGRVSDEAADADRGDEQRGTEAVPAP